MRWKKDKRKKLGEWKPMYALTKVLIGDTWVRWEMFWAFFPTGSSWYQSDKLRFIEDKPPSLVEYEDTATD